LKANDGWQVGMDIIVSINMWWHLTLFTCRNDCEKGGNSFQYFSCIR
jgi:hypothetical protein